MKLSPADSAPYAAPSQPEAGSEMAGGETARSDEAAPAAIPAAPSSGRRLSAQRKLGWPASIGISLTVHALAVGATIVRWSSPEPVDAPPAAAMIVELAAMPVAPATEPSDVPPGPEQVEADNQPVEQRKVDFDPPPQADPSIRPVFTLPIKERPEPAPQQVAAVEAKQTTAPPAAPVPATETRRAAPNEGNNMAPPSDAEQAWEGKLLAKLERNKRYPAAARSAGQEDTVLVRLVINRAGQLIDAKLKRSSGFNLLDEETLALAKRADPFPPPPAQLAGAQIVRIVPVEFYIKRRR